MVIVKNQLVKVYPVLLSVQCSCFLMKGFNCQQTFCVSLVYLLYDAALLYITQNVKIFRCKKQRPYK
jgi:hypothetical protein